MKLLGRIRRKNDEAVDRILDELELPSFPGVVTQVLGMLRDESVSARELAGVLEVDPNLHVRVLRAVNAAEHGLTSQVESVTKAIALLGRSRLEGLVVSVAVKDATPTSSVPGFDETSYWRTAARRAGTARALAKKLHRDTADEAFTAALLLDIGVPALLATHRDRYMKIYETWRADPETDLALLEQDSLGQDHTEVGARVVERWGLPDTLAQAVRDHHDGGDGVDGAPGVRVASLLRDAKEMDGTDSVLAACHDELGITPEESTAILAAAFQGADELVQALR